MRVQPSLLHLLQLGGATAIYFLAGKAGLSLAFLHSSASPVWLATGLALAFFLLFGFKLWPAVAVGAFLVNYHSTGNIPSSIGIALGNLGEALAGAWLAIRFAGGKDAFERPKTLVRYLAGAGVAACSISVSSLVVVFQFRIVTLGWSGFIDGAMSTTRRGYELAASSSCSSL